MIGVGGLYFIRPLWLLTIIPLITLGWFLWRQSSPAQAWDKVCDHHLLPHLLEANGSSQRRLPLLCTLLSGLFMVISLSGPTWSRLPVPSYQQIQPKILVLDMSESMLNRDLAPNRFTRAKFKLRDLLKQKVDTQYGLIVYSGEPFTVSPLTDDAKTIEALLPSLKPEIMPTQGQRLGWAISEAGKLINQAGYQKGDILILSSEAPSPAAIQAARTLAKSGIRTSIIPVIKRAPSTSAFQDLANAGQGQLIPFSDTASDLNHWLSTIKSQRFQLNDNSDIPVWRDQGRWFLIPALILLLPVFRQGWLQRMMV